MGPSLNNYGVTTALADPVLELHDSTGPIIAMNDNWADTQADEVNASGIPPPNDLESAIVPRSHRALTPPSSMARTAAPAPPWSRFTISVLAPTLLSPTSAPAVRSVRKATSLLAVSS
jgi:hypothetical protein